MPKPLEIEYQKRKREMEVDMGDVKFIMMLNEIKRQGKDVRCKVNENGDIELLVLKGEGKDEKDN